MIDGGAGAGLGGKHSILNRDSLLIKIELPASADICAVWKKSHADQILDAFINLLAQIVRRYDE